MGRERCRQDTGARTGTADCDFLSFPLSSARIPNILSDVANGKYQYGIQADSEEDAMRYPTAETEIHLANLVGEILVFASEQIAPAPAESESMALRMFAYHR